MSGQPVKRQRTSGSFSPASPPYHLAAKPSDTKPPVVHPNTPTSPPYMSSASQANGAPEPTATAPSSEMTPPSSVNMSQQFSQPAASATHPLPFPTPASTAGAMSSTNADSDGDAMMIDDDNEDATKSGDAQVRSGMDAHRRSDHNRQGKGTVFGDKDPSDGLLFKFCQNPHPMSRPHVSQNLFDLYGLNSIASSVARTDENGVKINRIRKSYEGHIKSMQLAGKPKAMKMEGKLMEPMLWPDQEYQIQRVHGKEIESALMPDPHAERPGQLKMTPNFEALCNQALTMAPGSLPSEDTQKYKSYLATDDGPRPNMTAEAARRKGLQPAPATRNPAVPSPGLRPSRPERTGTKRRYNDTSFVGYGEGYADDAESTAGEDDGRNSFRRKKPRKDFAASSPFGHVGLERPGHQMGMVGGVRR